MTIYDLITKWIREANQEYEKAKTEVNLQKMDKIQSIIRALVALRDKG